MVILNLQLIFQPFYIFHVLLSRVCAILVKSNHLCTHTLKKVSLYSFKARFAHLQECRAPHLLLHTQAAQCNHSLNCSAAPLEQLEGNWTAQSHMWNGLSLPHPNLSNQSRDQTRDLSVIIWSIFYALQI